MTTTNVQIADTYLEALRSKDCTKALLSPDVSLRYPLTPRTLIRKETVIEYMHSILLAIDDVKIEQHLTDGEYVVTLWSAYTVRATIPVCSVFRISDGLIADVRTYFDTRLLLP